MLGLPGVVVVVVVVVGWSTHPDSVLVGEVGWELVDLSEESGSNKSAGRVP